MPRSGWSTKIKRSMNAEDMLEEKEVNKDIGCEREAISRTSMNTLKYILQMIKDETPRSLLDE
jgi:hypothetical protein